ncbi:MAG: type I restriction endonuclease subunit R [Chloroflexi bacterium]|nr:type I restriction endonuclease subunit R [Chloroflexota bacterium]MYF79305.1 type I restriction endonuclease subunit R [Chloroflexota bacterium]
MTTITEDDVEQLALGWLTDIDWQTINDNEIGPESAGAERDDYGVVILEGRLRNALERLNPELGFEALEDAYRKLMAPQGTSLEVRNESFHRMLVEGVNVEYWDVDGHIRGAQVQVIDFEDVGANDLLAVNQFDVVENKHHRRPDVVLFVNGLPLGVVELKNPTDEDATIWTAWQQLQTYKSELLTLFSMNELLLVSDGLEARVGTLTADKEWFKPWRTIAGDDVADATIPQLEVTIRGLCEPKRFLKMMRDFIVFEGDGGGVPVKKMAGYHQYHAVEFAVEQTVRASQLVDEHGMLVDAGSGYETGRKPGGGPGDKRIGVVWHTQGAGKSLTMAFYAGRIAREPAMSNPTIVVLTDRNDLDDQLFGTFSRCSDLLRQTPTQAESRADLRRKLSVSSGGVVFTTIQKFFPDEKGDRHPMLSDRRNIVVIADEAHRSQYDFVDGFAAHMRDALPNASFIGFTGTPIEFEDRNTMSVFGDYISIYDIRRSVEDESTVRIHYESRLAKLELNEEERPHIDEEFNEATEGEEVERKERLKTKWAQIEAVVGTEKRLKLIAQDIVDHFEKRLDAMDGKAMIVCMSRRICVDLYEELVALKPEWHDEDDAQGEIKVVMTGSASDPIEWQQHIRNKGRREGLAHRFRDSADPFKVVLVRDMWLTGFDAPSLHTMYVDKPMRGHNLMQAIARVNRVFKDKPGGLIVDYLGLAPALQLAVRTYTESGGTGNAVEDLDKDTAVAVFMERYEVCEGLFHGFDWSVWVSGNAQDRLNLLPAAQEHVLGLDDGRDRCLEKVRELSQAFALATPRDEVLAKRNGVAFFQAVRAALMKSNENERTPSEDLDQAVRQIVADAVSPDGVIDVFEAAGLKKPDISILSEEFLSEVKTMERKNLAVELLRKLLQGEITKRRKQNVVLSRSFAEMLAETLRQYRNRAIQAAEVIERLIELAREMREANARGEKLGLRDDELAFYDALGTNDSAVKVMGDEVLSEIARDLVKTVRNNVTIDWTIRETSRANLRVLVRRTLRRYGYPPDKQEKATETVLEQAEVLSADWALARLSSTNPC